MREKIKLDHGKTVKRLAARAVLQAKLKADRDDIATRRTEVNRRGGIGLDGRPLAMPITDHEVMAIREAVEVNGVDYECAAARFGRRKKTIRKIVERISPYAWEGEWLDEIISDE